MKRLIPSRIIILLLALVIVSTPNTMAQSWNQLGADIDGEAVDDYSGKSVSMPDTNTVAIGAYENDGNGTDAGHVRVFRRNGSAWIQKGADIDGEAADDESGRSISMPDTNTLAIGAPYNDGNGNSAGHVRVYKWNGAAWIQKGADIDGEDSGDDFGWSVSMPDSNTLAIGAKNNMVFDVGHVRVFRWNGTAWIQKGADIDGEANGDEFGYSVSMPDTNTVAIGAHENDGNGTDAGHVRVYEWTGTAWVQKGADLDGEAAGDNSGRSVSMPHKNTLAIGAHNNDGNGSAAGHVRVFRWNGNAWIQKGLDIDGEAAVDYSGRAVSMPDTNTVAIGAYLNDSSTPGGEGHVRVYGWNGSVWIQKGLDIDGEDSGDESGWAVSMADANTLAIGAPRNHGNTGTISNVGHVRVYKFGIVNSIIENSLGAGLNAYPNPSEGNLFIELGTLYNTVQVVVTDVLGKTVLQNEFYGTNKIELDIVSKPGVYFVELVSDNGKAAMIKIIRE